MNFGIRESNTMMFVSLSSVPKSRVRDLKLVFTIDFVCLLYRVQ